MAAAGWPGVEGWAASSNRDQAALGCSLLKARGQSRDPVRGLTGHTIISQGLSGFTMAFSAR